MTTLKVSGMTCGNCVKHVTQALQAVPEAGRVDVDLAAGTARVEGDAEPQALIAALQEEGYPAEVA